MSTRPLASPWPRTAVKVKPQSDGRDHQHLGEVVPGARETARCLNGRLHCSEPEVLLPSSLVCAGGTLPLWNRSMMRLKKSVLSWSCFLVSWAPSHAAAHLIRSGPSRVCTQLATVLGTRLQRGPAPSPLSRPPCWLAAAPELASGIPVYPDRSHDGPQQYLELEVVTRPGIARENVISCDIDTSLIQTACLFSGTT